MRYRSDTLGQVRSLASEAAKQHNAAAASRTRVLDWYTFDFQEELSGLDGAGCSSQLLLEGVTVARRR